MIEMDSTTPLQLEEVRIDPAWALKIPAAVALRHRVIPLSLVNGVVEIGCANPNDLRTMQLLERTLGQPVHGIECDATSLKVALNRIYANTARATNRESPKAGGESDSSVALGDEILESAVMRSASDIHIIPQENNTGVWFRVDGQLELFRELSKEQLFAIVSRFKVLAELDIAEKRAPQDGRFTWNSSPLNRKTDIRVATLPTRFGERMTMRLLAAHGSNLSLKGLGFTEQDHELMNQAINRPHGMILLTGPTGSGKSTTLFASLKQLLAKGAKTVITVEDPIEYEIEGASQVEVDAVDKVSFNKALRSILRHDPDVIMIGEIRDGETADIAMKAALTGHLVFSTLHTNSAAAVVTRLLDMGMQPFLVAATLRLVVAQRLVRRLCQYCKVESTITHRESVVLGKPDLEGESCWQAGGCVRCAGRGYNGRVGLFEVFSIDEAISKLISDGANEGRLLEELRKRKFRFLVDDAIEKLTSGQTTTDEVLSAITVW